MTPVFSWRIMNRNGWSALNTSGMGATDVRPTTTAVAAAASPNGVTAEDFVRMSEYWAEGQVVEILAVVALYGFLNRWNDSLATTLEEPSQTVTEEILGSKGWDVGKHRRAQAADVD